MSTMMETLKDEALFIPSEETDHKKEYIPKVAGDYLGHITHARTLIKEFSRDGKTFKARIFNFRVKVAPENERNTYKIEDIDGSMKEIDGSHYIDWDIMADGVFRFLEPTDDDHFDSNAEGNKRYLMFCQSLGMDIKTEERTVNGKTLRVQILPNINVDDLNGTPVIAVVARGKDWVDKHGETKPSWRCKFTKRWESGTKMMDHKTDDLPF